MIKFENYTLGKTEENLAVDTSEQLALASLTMVKHTDRTLDIISRQLDPLIYDTAEFAETVKQLVLNNKRAKVRILAHEPAIIVRRGHRLVELAMKRCQSVRVQH